MRCCKNPITPANCGYGFRTMFTLFKKKQAIASKIKKNSGISAKKKRRRKGFRYAGI
jgi:hypothetical protein